jgi:hypothetical protein
MSIYIFRGINTPYVSDFSRLQKNVTGVEPVCFYSVLQNEGTEVTRFSQENLSAFISIDFFQVGFLIIKYRKNRDIFIILNGQTLVR